MLENASDQDLAEGTGGDQRGEVSFIKTMGTKTTSRSKRPACDPCASVRAVTMTSWTASGKRT
jgi:hypothetical protein